MRSYFAHLGKRMLVRQKRLLVPSWEFGHDPVHDIQRLATNWNYPITTIFDVGANDGDTACKMLKLFPVASILSFEPHPTTFGKLVARIGSAPRFKAFNLALSDGPGEAEMFEYDLSKVNSLTPKAPSAGISPRQSHTLRVPTIALDAFCTEHSVERIDVLKIDTEGFDLVVLQGAQEMLRSHAIKFIYVEFNYLQPREGVFGGALVPFDNLLAPLGYRFVAAYNDFITTDGGMFSSSNALFCLPPPAGKDRPLSGDQN